MMILLQLPLLLRPLLLLTPMYTLYVLRALPLP